MNDLGVKGTSTRRVGLYWLILVLLIGTTMVTARDGRDPAVRYLGDFKNADGKPPNGLDDTTDDTEALRKALAVGPGIVRVGPGFFRWGEITIPSDVAIVGAGPATVVRSNGAKRIFWQKSVRGWAIRDMTLDGEAKGDWKKREDLGQNGIATEGGWGFEIVGVTLRNFSGAGLQLTWTNLGASGWSAGGNLDRITAHDNYVGIRFDIRSEYMNATNLSAFHNVIGCVIHAGNAKITASNFGGNIDGIVIEDKDNGSHGAISNCLVNHNERYALLVRNAKNGMLIDGCCIFYGKIQIENSQGISITSGILNTGLVVAGDGANRIAGNYIIPSDFSIEFSRLTIVENNFTKEGPWEKNNR